MCNLARISMQLRMTNRHESRDHSRHRHRNKSREAALRPRTIEHRAIEIPNRAHYWNRSPSETLCRSIFASASGVREKVQLQQGVGGEVRRGRHPPSESISCSSAPTSLSFRLQVYQYQFSLSFLSLSLSLSLSLFFFLSLSLDRASRFPDTTGSAGMKTSMPRFAARASNSECNLGDVGQTLDRTNPRGYLGVCLVGINNIAEASWRYTDVLSEGTIDREPKFIYRHARDSAKMRILKKLAGTFDARMHFA